MGGRLSQGRNLPGNGNNVCVLLAFIIFSNIKQSGTITRKMFYVSLCFEKMGKTRRLRVMLRRLGG
jgi:hypothetical protein